MAKKITPKEYNSLANSLRRIKPLGVCCDNAMLDTIHVEPLAGRKKSAVKKSCIVQCPVCEKMYLSDWY